MEAFKTIIKPNDVHIIRVIKTKYKVFIGLKYQEWFIKSLKKWLQEWQALFSLYKT